MEVVKLKLETINQLLQMVASTPMEWKYSNPIMSLIHKAVEESPPYKEEVVADKPKKA